MTDWAEITRNWEAEEQRRREAVVAKKAALLELLKSASIATVEITYDGYGDSGQIDEIEAWDPTGNLLLDCLDKPDFGKSLRDLIDDFAWELLQAHHSGFENNEGGRGQIRIDVAAGTITLDHNDRVYEYVNTTTEV